MGGLFIGQVAPLALLSEDKTGSSIIIDLHGEVCLPSCYGDIHRNASKWTVPSMNRFPTHRYRHAGTPPHIWAWAIITKQGFCRHNALGKNSWSWTHQLWESPRKQLKWIDSPNPTGTPLAYGQQTVPSPRPSSVILYQRCLAAYNWIHACRTNLQSPRGIETISIAGCRWCLLTIADRLP